MQRFCLSDWDGTLRPGFILDDWLEHLATEGIVGIDFAAACNHLIAEFHKGLLPYNDLVLEAASVYASALKAVSQHEITLSAQRFVYADRSNLFPFTETLLALLQRNNIDTIVVSGGPVEVLEAYCHILPISSVYALRLKIGDSGHYTGEVLENHGLLQEKHRVVQSLKSQRKEVFLALGNAPTDQPLFASTKHAFLLQTEGLHYTEPGITEVTVSSFLPLVKSLLLRKEN